MNDEPVATGWLNTQLAGDIESAKMHVRTARKLLGQLRTNQGVNERIAAGEPGGFYKQVANTPDGARIEVLTNNGQDTIKITTTRKDHREEREGNVTGAGARPEAKAIFHSAQAQHPITPAPPGYLPGKRGDEEEENKEEESESNYLWVGVRVKDGCARPWYALEVQLLEPDGTGMRGIVATGYGGQGNWAEDFHLDATGSDDAGWAIADSAWSSDPASRDALLAAMYNTWGAGADPFSPGMIYGDHQATTILSGTELDDGGQGDGGAPTVNWSCNGLMMQYWLDNPPGYGPYDPLMDDNANAGQGRDFSAMDLTAGFGNLSTTHFGWDAVFWLDPNDQEAAGMVDDRPLTLALKRYLQDAGFMTAGEGQVLAGTYKLGVRAYDTPPELQSSRRGDAVTGLPADMPPPEFQFRSPYGDYQDYMAAQNVWPPLDVEVEVRLGRDSNGSPAATFRFDLRCEEYDDRFAVVYPFGADPPFDECMADFGANMGGPSYSQWVDIDVQGLSAELGGAPPERVYATGTWVPYASTAVYSAAFFVYGSVFPAVADSDWESYAGTALFTACEAVTTAVYGNSQMQFMSEAALQGLFAGTSKANVYMYDPMAGTLTNLGPPASLPADWAANDPPDDSTNFYWYYEFAVAYQNECWNTYGVLVTSVGGVYEMSQNFGGTPGYVAPSCC